MSFKSCFANAFRKRKWKVKLPCRLTEVKTIVKTSCLLRAGSERTLGKLVCLKRNRSRQAWWHISSQVYLMVKNKILNFFSSSLLPVMKKSNDFFSFPYTPIDVFWRLWKAWNCLTLWKSAELLKDLSWGY